MKTMLSTVLLSLGSALAFGQTPSVPFPMGSELQVGYIRETVKMRDELASPMLYVANLNGIRLSYIRQTLRNQWHIDLQASAGDLIAPGLGIRALQFVPEQPPLYLVPTLYRGELAVAYRRLVQQRANRSTYVGIGLHETVGYADGLALNTWAFNSADLRLLYQTRLTLGKRHTLLADAALPMLAAVSRMPYSNVVSQPNRSDVATFFGGTRWATVNRYFNPALGVNYRFELSHRVAFQAGYRYSYLRYPEPRPIRLTDHTISASILYKFQPKAR